MKSFLSVAFRAQLFAALAGGSLFAVSSVSAQVVEDKAPQPAAPAVNESDTIKETVKEAVPATPPSSTPDQTKGSGNVAAGAKLNAAQKAANTTGSTVADTAAQGAAAAMQATDNAERNAAAQTPATVNRSAEAVKNPADRATEATRDAADRANNAARNAADRANDASRNAADRAADRANAAAAGTRTNSADPNAQPSTVQQRINAGVNAGANAPNVGAGQIATQLGLNFAANAANALTLSTVQRNSVFANAGFVPGDQFVSIGGTPIANQTAFYRYLGTVPAGQRVPVVVLRNGQQQTIYWTPDQRFVQMQPTFRTYIAAAQPNAPAQAGMLGISLDQSVTDAAVVASVAAGSPAANAGVRQGDQIVALNEQEVHSADQFEQVASQLPANAPARISVARTMDLQLAPVQQTGAVAPSGPTYVQPAAPVGVVDPARAVPVGPVRRFRAR